MIHEKIISIFYGASSGILNSAKQLCDALSSNWQAHSWLNDLVFSMFFRAAKVIPLETFAVCRHSENL